MGNFKVKVQNDRLRLKANIRLMKTQKIIFLIGVVTILIVANVYVVEASIKDRAYTVAAFLLGANFVYGYVFSSDIDMTGYTIKNKERPVLRLMMFLLGLIIVFLSIWFFIN